MQQYKKYTTDEFGLFPTYILTQNGTVEFGKSVDELVKLAHQPLTIDYSAWACQLFFSYPLGNRTHFNEIKMIRPGDSWSVPQSKLESEVRINRYSPPNFESSISNFSEAVQEVAELLLSAVGKQLAAHRDKEILCFLSGGWDSRALACCLSKLTSPNKIHCHTTSYDSGNNKEESFAKMVSEALQVPHTVHSLPKDDYVTYFTKSLMSTDYSTDMHIWMLNFLTSGNFSKNTINFDGYGGNILFRGMFQTLEDINRKPTDSIFFERFNFAKSLQKLIPNPIFQTLSKLAQDELSSELAQYHPQNRMLWFLFRNRGTRCVAYSLRHQSQYLTPVTPFLDSDLIDYTLRIAPEIRLNKEFYPALLSHLNKKVGNLPSTNDLNTTGWSTCETIKCSPYSMNKSMSSLHHMCHALKDKSGILDWFSIEPRRNSLRNLTELEQKKHNLSIHKLHIYASWLEKYWEKIKHESVIKITSKEQPQSFVQRRNTSDYKTISAFYLKKIKKLPEKNSLQFHFTMDVEAIPSNDAHSVQTSQAHLIEHMIYGDFGNGSVIKRLFHQNKIPCTYFFEPYQTTWDDKKSFKNALHFFDTPYSEIGLHCHAFSLPNKLRTKLSICTPDWFLDTRSLSKVFKQGKKKIEEVLGDNINSFRSGRLDSYPNMEQAILDAGMLIDSSYISTRQASFSYSPAPTIPNFICNHKETVEIPITGYLSNGNIKALDFNNSSFEEICYIIYRALELNIPTITMLMHSWSFNLTTESSLLHKRFHVGENRELQNKFKYLVEFLRAISQVTLSTLTQTVETCTIPASNYNLKELKERPDAFQLNLAPLQVFATSSKNRITAQCIPNLEKFTSEIEFAYYLLADNKRIETIWYTSNDTVTFQTQLPIEGHIEVTGFVREKSTPDNKYSKRTSLL